MKLIILVGGVRFSGTTLLDMILANDPSGFSAGEVSRCFRMGARRHVPKCSCGSPECRLWDTVAARREQDVYDTIFRQDERLSFIVDSSKNPFWIRRMNDLARRRGWQILNVLIWKDPFASAHSFNKRGQMASWKREWLEYHRLYFSLLKDFVTVHYASFVQSPPVLDALCSAANIDNFPGKVEFWTKQHHNLGGNASTKIHLYDVGNPRFEAAKTFIERQANAGQRPTYRTIYSEDVDESEIERSVGIKDDSGVQCIVKALQWCDVTLSNSSQDRPSIPEYSRPYLMVRGILSRAKHTRLPRWSRPKQ